MMEDFKYDFDIFFRKYEEIIDFINYTTYDYYKMHDSIIEDMIRWFKIINYNNILDFEIFIEKIIKTKNFEKYKKYLLIIYINITIFYNKFKRHFNITTIITKRRIINEDFKIFLINFNNFYNNIIGKISYIVLYTLKYESINLFMINTYLYHYESFININKYDLSIDKEDLDDIEYEDKLNPEIKRCIHSIISAKLSNNYIFYYINYNILNILTLDIDKNIELLNQENIDIITHLYQKFIYIHLKFVKNIKKIMHISYKYNYLYHNSIIYKFINIYNYFIDFENNYTEETTDIIYFDLEYIKYICKIKKNLVLCIEDKLITEDNLDIENTDTRIGDIQNIILLKKLNNIQIKSSRFQFISLIVQLSYKK